MKTDLTLKEDLLDELDWESSIDATKIGIITKDGIVTLIGHVKTYAEKTAAEKATKRVAGVRAIVDEMDVQIGESYKRTDQDIAQTALNTLKWNTSIPEANIKLKVRDGWITLEGNVDWNYQTQAAKNAIKDMAGVRGVTNLINVKTVVEPRDVKNKIKEALKRNASIDANHIEVVVDGHRVILNGTIQSWAEKKQAENAAWSAPGVTEVKNNLEIKIREYSY